MKLWKQVCESTVTYINIKAASWKIARLNSVSCGTHQAYNCFQVCHKFSFDLLLLKFCSSMYYFSLQKCEKSAWFLQEIEEISVKCDGVKQLVPDYGSNSSSDTSDCEKYFFLFLFEWINTA